MSTATKLQKFLSYVDTGLFVSIKSIRRALEALQFDWVIAGDLAINMYSYMAGLQPFLTSNITAQIYINRLSKPSATIEDELKAFVTYLERVGFTTISEPSYGTIILVNSKSTTRYQFIISSDYSLFDNNNRVWLSNANDKLTYPLLAPFRLERQQLRKITYLMVDKENVDAAQTQADNPLVNHTVDGIEYTLSLSPVYENKVMIAAPLLMPCERDMGLRHYQVTKYILSEIVTSVEEETEFIPNRMTKGLIVSRPVKLKNIPTKPKKSVSSIVPSIKLISDAPKPVTVEEPNKQERVQNIKDKLKKKVRALEQ